MQHLTVQMNAKFSGSSSNRLESRRIKFDSSKAQKSMKIDQHPFTTNMLDAKGKAKVSLLNSTPYATTKKRCDMPNFVASSSLGHQISFVAKGCKMSRGNKVLTVLKY